MVYGLLALLFSIAGASLFGWLVAIPHEPSGRTGDQILLLLFAPAFAGSFLYFASRGLRRIRDGLTRFDVTERDITVRETFRTRVIRWSSVRGFLIPAARFPNRPQILVLLLDQNRRVTLPLERFRTAGADAILNNSILGLAEWGLEKVRLAEPTTLSPLRVRWRLHKSSLLALYGMPIFLLLLTIGSVMYGWRFVNYLRIRQSHKSISAHIREITKESGRHETVWTRVGYTAFNGQSVRLHRQVMVTFADRFKAGDQVAVDYLPKHPDVGRIPGWDLDGRSWAMCILMLLTIWFTARAMPRSAANWLCPLRERIAWAAKSSFPVVAFSVARLESLYEILPDKHTGALVLKPPPPNSKKPGLWAWARWLEKAGLKAHQSSGKFLILDSAQAKRLLDRMSGDNTFIGDYMILDSHDTEDAERIVSERFAKARPGEGDPSLDRGRFCCVNGVVGPLNDSEKRETFRKWFNFRLRRLYGGVLPPAIPDLDFARLFEMDPADGLFDLLIERRHIGPRIWFRIDQEKSAKFAECSRGRWIIVEVDGVPRYFKPQAAGSKLLRRMIAPIGSCSRVNQSRSETTTLAISRPQ